MVDPPTPFSTSSCQTSSAGVSFFRVLDPVDLADRLQQQEAQRRVEVVGLFVGQAFLSRLAQANAFGEVARVAALLVAFGGEQALHRAKTVASDEHLEGVADRLLPAGGNAGPANLLAHQRRLDETARRTKFVEIHLRAPQADFGVHLPAPERWMVAWVATSVLLAKSKGKSLT